jgi:hypothetical protein
MVLQPWPVVFGLRVGVNNTILANSAKRKPLMPRHFGNGFLDPGPRDLPGELLFMWGYVGL